MKQNSLKKYIFLDIDNTLVTSDGKMPESASKAIKKAQKNGHEVFLCSGRNYTNIYDFLLEFGFNGYVAGTGSCIVYNNSILHEQYFTPDQVKLITSTLNDHSTPFLITTNYGCIFQSKYADRMADYFSNGRIKSYKDLDKDKSVFIDSLRPYICDDDINSYSQKYKTCTAIIYADCDITVDKLAKKFGDAARVKKVSYNNPNDYSGEITIKKCSKAKGIDFLLKHVGANKKDTIAVGDSYNDLDMLNYCHFSVAVGNAIDEVKKISDFVSDTIENDGLYKAFKHLSLI